MSAIRRQDNTATPKCEIDKSAMILASCSLMTALSCVVLVARIYARGWLSHSTDRDDYAMWAAVAFSIAGFAVTTAEVLSGGGGYGSCLSPEDLRRSLMLLFISQPLFILAILLVKVSIVFCLLRFSPSKAFSRLLWGVMIFFVITGVMYFFSEMIRCQPLRAVWDPKVEGVCISPSVRRAIAYTNDSISLVVDILLATLPIPMIWQVQVPTYVKALIGFVMSLGALAAAACAVKINYLTPAAFTGDPLFDSIQWSIWTTVECNVGIAAASVPSIIPLIKKFHTLRKGLHSDSHEESRSTAKDSEQEHQKHRLTEGNRLQQGSEEPIQCIDIDNHALKREIVPEIRIGKEESPMDSGDDEDISEMYANASRNITKET